VGEFVKGKKHGKGVLTESSGDVYEGTWVKNSLEGQGKLTTKDNIKYIGEFVKSKKHGQGVMTYSDGSMYEGYVGGRQETRPGQADQRRWSSTGGRVEGGYSV